MIRFHLDESVQVALATALRQRGIDVTTAADAGLVSASDEEQLRFALANDRVVVSYDSDFLHLHQAGSPHAGIVYCVPGRHEVGYLVRILCLLHDCLSSEEMRGRVEFI